jgi:hypothetical protein
MAIICPPDIRKLLLEEVSKLMLNEVLPKWLVEQKEDLRKSVVGSKRAI